METSADLCVLVVDDDADTRANLADILELDGFRIHAAGTVAEALDRRNWSHYSAIILDRRLPDGSAEGLLPTLRQIAPSVPVIIATGYADVPGTIAALRLGAADYILKPIDPDELRARLKRIVELQQAERQVRRAEAELRREHEFAESLIEKAQAIVLVLDVKGRIVRFNAYMEQLSGYSLAEVRGKDWFATFLPAADWPRIREVFLKTLGGADTSGTINPILTKAGRSREIQWSNKTLPGPDGRPGGVLAIGHDITELREAQERALQAERLAAIGQVMTGLAHESRNALARSRACLELLACEVGDRPDALDLVRRAEKAQDYLAHLYEEVRAYAAPIVLDRENLSLPSIWRQAWNNLAVVREGRQATLRERIDGIDLQCPVDPFRMEQVFRNLFENSLAACADPVLVEVACSKDEIGRRPAVRIAVRDNGPGLTAEQRQRFFEPFYTTKTKGTGLGTAIAKRIVEAHGGQIALGNGDRGAEILIMLPTQ
jgi:hypothetical protein